MPLLTIIEVFVLVAVLMGLINFLAHKFPQVFAGNVISALNAIVVVLLVIWVLCLFLPIGNLGNIRVGHP